MMTTEEQAQAWVYYQDLVRTHGFKGITDLLAKYDTMRRECVKAHEALLGHAGGGVALKCLERALPHTGTQR